MVLRFCCRMGRSLFVKYVENDGTCSVMIAINRSSKISGKLVM